MALSEFFPAHVRYKSRADFASNACMKIVRRRAP